ncbi:MAG: formate dehydrogenase accessory sulfurtransferase FdhD [Polyangiaceae bacterium]
MSEEHEHADSASVRRTEWRARESFSGDDLVSAEEPLEIRIGSMPVAVVMRTPGNDEELVRGFLITEAIASFDQVATVKHCDTITDPDTEGNVARVTLREGVSVDLSCLQRNLYASSSCGVCGKASIDSAMRTAPPLEQREPKVNVELLYSLPPKLKAAQQGFSRTGGLHAAALFTSDGELLVTREDVGRHNAVDKVIGYASMQRWLPLHRHVLLVSGRVSFEITQKALAARIGLLAAVSAPSSLAIALAERAGVTLAAFLRDRRVVVYGDTSRVSG